MLIFSQCSSMLLSVMEPLDPATKCGINHSSSQAVFSAALWAAGSKPPGWKEQCLLCVHFSVVFFGCCACRSVSVADWDTNPV